MDKINIKLSGWKARMFSQAGKIILIKSNLTGIQMFTMQGIKIPSSIAKEIDKKYRVFF